ncbi:MAG: histidine kinase dimerization/phosphoacceptor domain -containing protein [Flavobacterium sp.]
MKFKLIFLTLIIYILSVKAFCQDAPPDSYQDSLQSIIKKSIKKTEKKEALFLLGEHLVQRDPTYAQKIAIDLRDNYLSKSDSVNLIRNKYILAASHRWLGDYKTALEYYNEIYLFSKNRGDINEVAKSSHFIGTLNMFLGNNILSQKYLVEASDIYDRNGTEIEKAKIKNTLAGFYLNINQYEKGKEQYLKALEQFIILKDSAGVASANANLGYIFIQTEEFENAEFHLMEQKKFNKVFPTQREMGFHHDVLGLLRQKQGRLEEAYKEHLKALKIREKLSSTYNLCESKLNMGQVLIKLNKPVEAIPYLLDVFKYEEHQSLNQQQSANALLSEAYESLGNYNEALQYFKTYKEISDSIFSKESMEIIAERDAVFEKQKKEAEIDLLQKEKEISESKLFRSQTVLTITLIGLVFLILASIGLYKLYVKIKDKNQIIEKTLKDRELLLHETHHRVKNNLQMISSLLNLQSKYVDDKKAYEALQNGRNRVESIAILHKNLYVGDDLTLVNVEDYFQSLVKSILSSFDKYKTEIEVDVNAKGLLLDVETVIPIGFIVNELVTNSFKHAKPEKENLRISLSMIDENDTYKLIVYDNGKGILEDKLIEENEETFGHRLIRTLVQKLKATMDIHNMNGTKISIVIPKKLSK